MDVLSLDCYRKFKQSYYDDLLKLANGKPVALAEVGGNLSLDVLKAQPKWAWWMEWAGSGRAGRCHEPPRSDCQGPPFLEPERSRLPQGHRAHSRRLRAASRAAGATGTLAVAENFSLQPFFGRAGQNRDAP